MACSPPSRSSTSRSSARKGDGGVTISDKAPPRKGDAALEVDGRARIFAIIRDSPGIHVREIERRAGVGYGSVDYHLRRLVAAGVVRAVEEGNQHLYYVAEFPRAQREMAGLVRQEPVRRIFAALLAFSHLTHGELAQVAGMSASTLSHHLKRLTTKGVVVTAREGRALAVRLSDPAAVERAILAHSRSIADPALDAYVAIWNEWRRPARPKKSAPSDQAEPVAP